MSTTAATSIAIVAATSASHSSTESDEAKKISCKSYEQTFNSNTATVAQKQQYAECVELLYLSEYTINEILAIKGSILVFIVLWIVCVTKMRIDYNDWEDSILFGLFYATAIFLGLALVAFLFGFLIFG